ncbi:MAG: hypothetical protein KF754_02670 [Planctomycetes bacterium]|nr:hypothetical protein [Planctomycetota bacterium]
MVRTIALIALFCGPLAAQAPSPRECFETFMRAVRNTDNMEPAARKLELQRCFDFDAWVEQREATDGKPLELGQRDELRREWALLLASDEFQTRWKTRTITVVEAPEPTGTEAVLTISLAAEGKRGDRFLVKLRLQADSTFWRWYAIEPLDQKAGDNPLPALTPEQRLALIAMRLAELDKAEAALAAEREALLRTRRLLLSREAEERGFGTALGSPQALARELSSALTVGDWGAFVLAHAPGARAESGRARFDAQRERGLKWAAQQAWVQPDGKALIVLQVSGQDRTRVVTLRAVKRDGRWWVEESP